MKHPDEIHVDYRTRYYSRAVKRIIPQALEVRATKYLPEQLMLVGKDLDKGKQTAIPYKAIQSLRPAARAAAIILALMGSAEAHAFYPPSCCGGQDCAPIPDGSVKYTSAGWLIIETGETIPFADAQISHDQHFHRCKITLYPEKTRKGCFFAPGAGT